mmetsp:Transcript_120455/g.236761  ORF Transcript_120455/g.236761 Transcript_120455/m.236761 type:complete len:232 (-) Transcript_120455:321-1016(-)
MISGKPNAASHVLQINMQAVAQDDRLATADPDPVDTLLLQLHDVGLEALHTSHGDAHGELSMELVQEGPVPHRFECGGVPLGDEIDEGVTIVAPVACVPRQVHHVPSPVDRPMLQQHVLRDAMREVPDHQCRALTIGVRALAIWFRGVGTGCGGVPARGVGAVGHKTDTGHRAGAKGAALVYRGQAAHIPVALAATPSSEGVALRHVVPVVRGSFGDMRRRHRCRVAAWHR